jgi:AraC family mar-sox-rob regulon transcriptional activator
MHVTPYATHHDTDARPRATLGHRGLNGSLREAPRAPVLRNRGTGAYRPEADSGLLPQAATIPGSRRLPPALIARARPAGDDSPCIAEAQADKASYLPLSPTTERVLQLLLHGDLSRLRAESIAEALGISCTTLRRRLREDHTNYQFLLDRARQFRCESLLHRRWLPGKCLAEELGYLEINSFYRAFQRWTGISYSDYKLRRPAATVKTTTGDGQLSRRDGGA